MLLDVQRGQVAAVQVVKVTDGQFGFLQLDFNQVALIAARSHKRRAVQEQCNCSVEAALCGNCDIRV